MKNFLWPSVAALIVLAGKPVAVKASGDNDRSNLPLAMFQWGGGIEPHINHLNRMVGQVRWQLTRYHADASVRRTFAEIRQGVDHVNAVYKAGNYDRRQLRREIDGLHERLHQLEIQMKVRANDYYNWR